MSCIPLMKRTAVRALPWLATVGLAVTLAHAGETVNKIGISMVDIPGGSFMMGSCKLAGDIKEQNKKRSAASLDQAALASNCMNADPNANDREAPQHRISVRAFRMSKTEVTLGQFKQFSVAAGRSDLVNDDFMRYNAYGDDAPVMQVSWHDAQAFIDWLNKTDRGGYRLPSEAEWEYACRAGGNHAYCGSDNLDSVAWYNGNSGNRARPVGRKQANAFGLFDMSGNAWEWVQDCWHDSYRGAPSDGSAWTDSCKDGGRVLRGGSWNYNARSTRSANRDNYSPDYRFIRSGFRLASTR